LQSIIFLILQLKVQFMIKNHFALLFFNFCISINYAQSIQPNNTAITKDSLAPKKTITTTFTSEKIILDGVFEEKSWLDASVATDFVMLEPDNGKPIDNQKRTEVRVIYNNDGIYIAAKMHDSNPSKILREITERDNFGASDIFGVFINGYNDGQQDFSFYVTAGNTQVDAISTNSGDDFSWNAIWDSKAIITNNGWAVEMKIPYAAVRFPSQEKQLWGINFFREIKRDRYNYTWNFVNNKIGTFTQQAGILEGIENIKPPTRLFLLPYTSYYLNANKQNKTKGTIKGGLDIKYGINEAFTLDVILVPDFGQTAIDQKVLNLGPFEQQFNENRSFFTEGVDLFSKGSILYTRRIGGNPTGTPILNTNEVVLESPINVSLLNALKVSGRTNNGLGIGILNAITKNTYATILNNATQETRKELIEPLANYNVLVFDQRFRKNSSISFINTNVTRNGSFRDANVSALVWDLNTKETTYGLQGNFKYSFVNQLEPKKGISTYLEFNKTSGKFRHGFGSKIVTKNYDINDLGINFETNYYNIYANSSYRILNPTKHFNSFSIWANVYTEFQKNTGKIKNNSLNIRTNITNKKNNSYGFGVNMHPLESYDYYEPRAEGRYVINPDRYGAFAYYSTNYAKKFAFDISLDMVLYNELDRNYFGINLAPRYRFNNKFSLIYQTNYSKQNNNKGFVDNISDAIIFSNRNINSLSNNLTAKYSLNSNITLNAKVAHYWSYSENKNFLTLTPNGLLTENTTISNNYNQDFSTWNLDLSLAYWFAPGSQISVLYRNNSFNYNSEIQKNYSQNISTLLNNNILDHIFSVSINYFIDYNSAKNVFTKRR